MPTTTLVDTSLGVRAIGDRTDFDGLAVTDITAEEDRFPTIIFTPGALKPSNAFVPASGAAATMDVVIGSGAAKTDYFVVDGRAAGQGNYVVRLEGATSTVTLAAAGVQPRIDEVYLVVRDNAYDTSTRGVVSLAVRQGDEAASPVAPGPDGTWQAYALIASVSVPSTAVDIIDCTITDERDTSTIDASGVGTPVGSVLPYVGASAPLGFLLAQGQAISRTTYPVLFGLMGTTFGAGDGSTTFNLPDMRQRFPLGKAASGTGSTLGSTGGAIDHTHTGPSHTHSGPSHAHTMGTHTHSGPSHSHTVDPPSTTSSSAGGHSHTMPTHQHSNPTTGSSTVSHTHSFSDSFTVGDATGGSTSNVASGGVLTVSNNNHNHSGTASGTTGGASSSSHSHSVGSTGSTDPGDTNAASSHTHATNIASFSSAAAGTGSTGATDPGDTNAAGTGATGASGTGATGSQNPPYLVLNYIIRAA